MTLAAEWTDSTFKAHSLPLLGGGDFFFAGRLDFLELCVGEYGDTTITGISHDFLDNLRHLTLQFFDKLHGVVLLVLDIAQLLLPDTRQLTTLQQFLTDKVDQFDTRWSGDEPFAIALDVMALEEGLDDAGTGRRTTDAVLLHGST